MTASISAQREAINLKAQFSQTRWENPRPEDSLLEREASQLRAILMSLSHTRGAQSLGEWPLFSPSGMVDVRHAAPHVRILPAPPWSASRERFWIRFQVVSRLESAARSLPSGFSLGFWEGYRPLAVQNRLWHTGLELVSAMYPLLNPEQLEDVLDIYIARPTSDAPHTQGRAVDVALLDTEGRIREDAEHLNMLSEALSDAGLSNYEPEWWHWSYDAEDEIAL